MTPLTREQIAELRTLLDLARAATFRTVGVRLNNLEALLDIAEAVANAPVATLSRADIGAWNLPDSWSGRSVAVLPLAGEVANG